MARSAHEACPDHLDSVDLRGYQDQWVLLEKREGEACLVVYRLLGQPEGPALKALPASTEQRVNVDVLGAAMGKDLMAKWVLVEIVDILDALDQWGLRVPWESLDSLDVMV